MRNRTLLQAMLLALTVGLSASSAAAQTPLPPKYGGTISDYVQALNATWLVSGEWSVQIDGQSGRGEFAASLTMFDLASPGVSHTHHVKLPDGVVVLGDGTTAHRFTLSGAGVITGQGNAAWVDAPIEVSVSGGNAVAYSNISVTLGGAAAGHFGATAIGGVVKAGQ